MLPTLHVKPSLLLCYIFFNIHKNLTEKFLLTAKTIDLVWEKGSTKTFTMNPTWRWSHSWKYVSLKMINIEHIFGFVHAAFYTWNSSFHTIRLKDRFYIFIFFCFILLLLSKISQFAIPLYSALV